MPQPGAIDAQMAAAIAEVNAIVGGGGVPPSRIFAAGHSLGATAADVWARNHSGVASGGVVLMGGYPPY
eukprot:gene10145-19930_t